MKNLLMVLSLAFIGGCVYYVPVEDYERQPLVYDNQEQIVKETIEVADDEFIITPQDYGILATRVTNKMLDDTKHIFENNPQPTIYIRDIVKNDEKLPDGFYYANGNIDSIIRNSDTFAVIANQTDADYVLSSNVSGYSNPSTLVPMVLFSVKLLDKNGDVVEEWVESFSKPADEEAWQ